MTDWKQAAIDAASTAVPIAAQNKVQDLGIPLTGEWHKDGPYTWRYSVDGATFKVSRFLNLWWVVFLRECFTCSKEMHTPALKDQADVGNALAHFYPTCSQCEQLAQAKKRVHDA